MPHLMKALIGIEIIYDMADTTPDQIRAQLDHALVKLSAECLLSGDLSATVDQWDYTIDFVD